MNEHRKDSKGVVSSTDIYTRYCEEIDKEDRLVNDRINWLLVQQSILFAAVGFAGGSAGEIIARIVPLVGCALSVAIWLSVAAAISSCMRYRHLLEQTSLRDRGPDRAYPQLHRNPVNIWMGHIAPIVMPGIFVGAWAYLIATQNESELSARVTHIQEANFGCLALASLLFQTRWLWLNKMAFRSISKSQTSSVD